MSEEESFVEEELSDIPTAIDEGESSNPDGGTNEEKETVIPDLYEMTEEEFFARDEPDVTDQGVEGQKAYDALSDKEKEKYGI